MVPKPKIPSTTGAGSSNTAALVAAAGSTAAAAELLAKLASDQAKKPACPVSKASVRLRIGATLPVLDHATAASSAQPTAVTSAASTEASAAPSAQPKVKAATFAGRYPPPDPQRRSGWDNMVRDYHKQKAENNKRKMSQEKWYTLHAADYYGQKVRKTVMKKPACPVSSDVGAGGDAGEGGDGAGGEEESPRVEERLRRLDEAAAARDDGAGPDGEEESGEEECGDDESLHDDSIA